MDIILKSIFAIIFFLIIFGFPLQQQKSYSINFIHSNSSDITTMPGYVECFIDYKTSYCGDCPPACLSFNSSNIIVNNKFLARHMDQVFEKQTRQISEVRAGGNKNDTYAATIYLYSLLIKNQIKLSEVHLIENIIKEIQTASSPISLGKYVKEKLNNLTSDENSTPIAISIVGITAKSIDLLINKDNLLYSLEGNPNLINDFGIQKKWIMEILNNAIIGCDESGITGCLASSVASTGVT